MLRNRLAKLDIPGKIDLVRRALELLMQGAHLSAADQAAARILDQALAGRRTDIQALDAELAATGSGLAETVWPHIMGVLGRAGRGERKGVTEAAALAIESLARRVDRTNPALAWEIRNVGGER